MAALIFISVVGGALFGASIVLILIFVWIKTNLRGMRPIL